MTKMTPQVSKQTPRWRWLLLGLLLAGLLTAQSWATYRAYTSRFPGANDFIARWANGCALVWSGENPYSEAVTLQTQMRMYGRPALPGEDLAAYSYPLYALYFFWPLCYVQPYALVQAIWMTLLLYGVIAGTALTVRLAGWRPAAWLWGLTLLWTVLDYPQARAVILGQMATVVFVAATLALLALQRRADFWAGAALAVTTIKPQICFLIVPWLLWWSAWQRRWRLWAGFGAAMALLIGSGLLLLPTWPADFARHVLRYDEVAGSGYHSLVWMLTRHFWQLGLPVEVAVTALLGLYLLFEWWQNRRATGQAMLWVTGLTLNLTHFISYRAATTAYTLLLLPLFQLFWLAEQRLPRRESAGRVAPAGRVSRPSDPARPAPWVSIRPALRCGLLDRRSLALKLKHTHWAAWVALAAQGALLVGQWAVFLSTVEGRFETAAVYLVWPVPLLLAQLVTRRYFVAERAR